MLSELYHMLLFVQCLDSIKLGYYRDADATPSFIILPTFDVVGIAVTIACRFRPCSFLLFSLGIKLFWIMYLRCSLCWSTLGSWCSLVWKRWVFSKSSPLELWYSQLYLQLSTLLLKSSQAQKASGGNHSTFPGKGLVLLERPTPMSARVLTPWLRAFMIRVII